MLKLIYILIFISCGLGTVKEFKTGYNSDEIMDENKKIGKQNAYRYLHSKLKIKKLPRDYEDLIFLVNAKTGLNLRKEPMASAPIVALIPNGSIIDVLKETKEEVIANQNGNWLSIRWENPENSKKYYGFVFSQYIVDGYRSSFIFKVGLREISPSKKYFIETLIPSNYTQIEECAIFYSGCRTLLFDAENNFLKDFNVFYTGWDDKEDFLKTSFKYSEGDEQGYYSELLNPISNTLIWERRELDYIEPYKYTCLKNIRSCTKQICRYKNCFRFLNDRKNKEIKVIHYTGDYNYEKEKIIFKKNGNEIELTKDSEKLTFYIDENEYIINEKNQVVSVK